MLSERIKELRLSRCMNQVEFAKKSNKAECKQLGK